MPHYYEYWDNPALAEVLPTLGASPEVVDFILSQEEPKLKGLLLNAVKKFPGITVAELEQIAPPKKRVPTEQEINWINQWPMTSGAFEAWLLVQLMKHRYQALPAYSPHKGYTYVFPGIVSGNADNYFVLFTQYTDRLIWGLLSQVWDWVSHTNSRIESYSWKEAIEASQAWHEACSLEGAGEEYREQNIAYRYPDGWSIQEVRTENDLDVEGNRMGHCVGSYADQVSGGKTRIFSLRDPQNQPHVTIEAGDSKDKQTLFIKQIQGKSNKPPIPEYRARVRDWFQEIGAKTSKEWTNERDIEELFEAWLKGEVNALREKGGNVFLDYGLRVPFSEQIMYDLYEGLSESTQSDMDLAERLAGDPQPRIPWTEDSKVWRQWEEALSEGLDQSIQEFLDTWSR
jgi:hypothetical protein